VRQLRHAREAFEVRRLISFGRESLRQASDLDGCVVLTAPGQDSARRHQGLCGFHRVKRVGHKRVPQQASTGFRALAGTLIVPDLEPQPGS
jgi:hypothetical protein